MAGRSSIGVFGEEFVRQQNYLGDVAMENGFRTSQGNERVSC